MLEIHVGWNPMRAMFECYAVKDGRSMAQPLVLKEIDSGEWQPPTIPLTPEEAQYLADQLWQAGVRPVGSKQSQGAFDAQGRHLEDMRSLVFKVTPESGRD